MRTLTKLAVFSMVASRWMLLPMPIASMADPVALHFRSTIRALLTRALIPRPSTISLLGPTILNLIMILILMLPLSLLAGP
jgi:hypothetical protein